MMFFATPRRVPQILVETRPGPHHARTLSARARRIRRAAAPRITPSTRSAKRRVMPWHFWWSGPTYEA